MERESLQGRSSGADGVAVSDSGDSAAAMPSGHDSTAAGTRVKVCCNCGRNVSAEKRYKDAQGRYWCSECGETDSMRKHPVACGDCGKPFMKKELEECEGVQVCAGCADKRRKAAKRAAARIAAAEAEGEKQHARWRIFVIAAVSVGAAVGLYLLVWMMFLRSSN